MKAFKKQVLAVFTALTFVHAHPQGGFHLASLNPAWAMKRALYNLDDIKDTSQKGKLIQGLKDAVTVAAKVIDKMDDDAHKDKLAYWFGDLNSGDEQRKKIKEVYKNFVGDNSHGTGSDKNGLVLVFSDDYWVPKSSQGGPGDGKTPFCSLESKGKTGTAYYKKTDDNKPGMHYCDKVWTRANLGTLTDNSCSKLGEHISTALWTKNFIGANVLHEFMHFPRIGKDAIQEQIGDWSYDAFQCRELATSNEINLNDKKKRKNKELTIVNADTYVWYALNIAFEELCKKKFSGPRDERDDDETNQDWPDSNP